MTEPKHWHLDKRVPISLIAAIAMQTACFIWFLSMISHRVDETQRRTEILEVRAAERAAIITNNSTAIAVIQETNRNIEAALRRIEEKIDEKSAP